MKRMLSILLTVLLCLSLLPAAGMAEEPVSVALTKDGSVAVVTGPYEDLYVRIALVIDMDGVSGLYVTQGVLNDGGVIVVPEFAVPGLTVTGVNVALVPDAGDISTPEPMVMASDFFRRGGEEPTFTYEHDPRDNPQAMEDIVADPDAVYGFSPDLASVRLGRFADAIDWSDPDQVAEARAEREAYHESMDELYDMIDEMWAGGSTMEEIARAVSTRRNELRLEAYTDPLELELVKQSNFDAYGNENGPTPEFLYEKYGSWKTIIEKALSTNMGMDACLGLYDEYYHTYMLDA